MSLWKSGAAIALLALAAACGGEEEASCGAGTTECDGRCVDTSLDPAHCGACGQRCEAGASCVDGTCVAACPGELVDCDGACRDTATDPLHCGGCDAPCGAGELCAGGSCVLSCPEGQEACDGGCHDLDRSPFHCGGCGVACADGEICEEGSCVASCPAGQTECDGACVDTARDRANCGGCGVACAGGEICVDGGCQPSCADGLTACDGVCRDTDTDRAHCGACGNACADGEICSAGSCVPSCGPFAPALCDGACTNTDFDPAHCGSCGNACAAGQVCSAGVCADLCAPHLDVCDGVCTDTRFDPAHCGACGTTCEAPAGAVAVCAAGACDSVCMAGRADCDGDAETGCEVALLEDPAHCGVCGNACPEPPNGTAGCSGGTCIVGACDEGFGDCDALPANGCETSLETDPANCGGCGISCGPTEICVQGGCVGAGESCLHPIEVTSGTQTVTWDATVNDYFVGTASVPSCLPPNQSVDGPDVVLAYQASADGGVKVRFGKPNDTRWLAVVSNSCGDVVSELACITDYVNDSMEQWIDAVAGETYYVHLIDTDLGFQGLSTPLVVHVEECAARQPAAAAFLPPDGGTTTTLVPTFQINFTHPVAPDAGTITIVGDAGTDLSFPLPNPAISFLNEGRSVVLTPGHSFPPGETLTISWSGLEDAECGAAIPAHPWTVHVLAPACAPGVGGVVGLGTTAFPTNLAYGSEYYVVADADPNGSVYFGGSNALYRMPKAGGAVESVHLASGLDLQHLGFAMAIDGPNVFVVADVTNGTSGHLYRISTDAGATWTLPVDFATFTPAPQDDFRAATAGDGQVHLITHEGTSSAMTQIWSVPTAPASVPAAATLVHEFPASDYSVCGALAIDAVNYYAICRIGTSGANYAIIRIDRASGVVSEIATGFPGNNAAMALHASDVDGDGVADFLYARGNTEKLYFVCDPNGASPTMDVLYDFGSDPQRYGLGFDPVANALWIYAEETEELIRIQ